MLQLTGKCLGTKREVIQGPSGPFESVTIRLQQGEGFDLSVHDVRPARDFPNADLPRDGETVTLNVVVSTYATKQGSGYRLTALSREHKGARVAAPSGV